MDNPPPLTPLTKKDPPGTRRPFRQIAWRLLVAILIWLVANLVVFVGAAFLIFVTLGSLGMPAEEGLFTIAVVCAIPLALTASGMIAGRRISHLMDQRYK